MKIKNYKKLRNNVYQITFEEKEEDILLYDDIILKYNLLFKKEVNEKELQEITKENNSLNCYYKALKYLNSRNRCQKEIRDYLKRNGFEDNDIKKTIEKLKEKKYLNDDIYLQSFINDQVNLTNNGPQKIKQKLLELGFLEEQINSYLVPISDEVWQDKLKKIIEKKVNTNKKDGKYKMKERLLYNCINMGYFKEDIIDILENIEYPDNIDFIEREAEKLYKKLSSKYHEPDLTYQIKGRLLNKGFTYEQVENVLLAQKKYHS